MNVILLLASNVVEQGIKKLHEQLYQDADGGKLSDVYEIMHELGPLNPSTYPLINDSQLPKFSPDCYLYEWLYVADPYFGAQKIIDCVKSVAHEGNILGVVVFDEAFHEMPVQLSLRVSAFDGSKGYQFITCTSDIPLGFELLYSYLYTAVVGNVLEFHILLDTIGIGLMHFRNACGSRFT